MGEEASSYYVVGRRVRYGYYRGGDDVDNDNSYGRRCFERPGREEGNKGESATAATKD